MCISNQKYCNRSISLNCVDRNSFGKEEHSWRKVRILFVIEMLKLYGDDLIKVKFGDGPLGFRVGETESGNVIVSGFSQNGDSYYPIYVADRFAWFY